MPAEVFERKIFITAKVRELTAAGEAKLTDFTRPTYLAMLDELGKELGETGLEKLAPDERPNELRLALAGKQALIIFDNWKPCQKTNAHACSNSSRACPRQQSHRHLPPPHRRGRADARLNRLARDEALQFIAELAAKYPRLTPRKKSAKTCTRSRRATRSSSAGSRGSGREGSQCRTIAEACAFIDKAPKKGTTRSNTSSATCWRPSPLTRRKSSPVSNVF